MARYEKDAAKAELHRAGRGERRHAEILVFRKLEKEGVALPPFLANPRPHGWRAGSSEAVVPTILARRVGDADKYDAQGGDASAIADEEPDPVVLAGWATARPATPAPSSPCALARGAGRLVDSAPPSSDTNHGLLSNLSLILAWPAPEPSRTR